jgi:hypothetical protein
MDRAEDMTMERIELTEVQKRSRRNRNIAIGVSLFALAVIFYAITIVRVVPPGHF